MEHILCRIEYKSKDNPKVKIHVNDKIVHTFVADKNYEKFEFCTREKKIVFKIEHYDKNMKREIDKHIEIKKIYFNDIDIKNMIWETIQKAEVPSWQNKNDFVWKSNLFLGHNASISYNLQSPIIEFLLNYHQPNKKLTQDISSNDDNLLYEMKDYFQSIVNNKKNINR